MITLDDEDVAAASNDRWEALGTIVLSAFRTRHTGRYRNKRQRVMEATQNAVHERSKKAGSHQVM